MRGKVGVEDEQAGDRRGPSARGARAPELDSAGSERDPVMEVQQQEKPKTPINEAMNEGSLQGVVGGFDSACKGAQHHLAPKSDPWMAHSSVEGYDGHSSPSASSRVGCSKKCLSMQHLDWSMAEVDGNPNASEELRQLAKWARQQQDKPKSNPRTRSLATDPEATSVGQGHVRWPVEERCLLVGSVKNDNGSAGKDRACSTKVPTVHAQGAPGQGWRTVDD